MRAFWGPRLRLVRLRGMLAFWASLRLPGGVSLFEALRSGTSPSAGSAAGDARFLGTLPSAGPVCGVVVPFLWGGTFFTALYCTNVT
jgi:hypothetical protein